MGIRRVGITAFIALSVAISDVTQVFAYRTNPVHWQASYQISHEYAKFVISNTPNVSHSVVT